MLRRKAAHGAAGPVESVGMEVAGQVALRFGLRSTEAMTILLEATIRVRDVGDKLAASGDPSLKVTPQPFEAVIPET